MFSSVYLLFLRKSNPIIHFPLLQWGETRSHVYPRNSIISIIYTVARSLTELPFTHRSTIGCG
jgi:DNA repair protein RadC